MRVSGGLLSATHLYSTPFFMHYTHIVRGTCKCFHLFEKLNPGTNILWEQKNCCLSVGLDNSKTVDFFFIVKMINCDTVLAQMEYCCSNIIVSIHLNDALFGSYAAGLSLRFSSCQIDVICRQKIEQPGSTLGSIFLLVSSESSYGSCSSYQEEIPRPGPLLTAL